MDGHRQPYAKASYHFTGKAMKPNQAKRRAPLAVSPDVAMHIDRVRKDAFRAGMELARAEAAKVAGLFGMTIAAAILAIDLDALGEKE
jgi:hypothetical protein